MSALEILLGAAGVTTVGELRRGTDRRIHLHFAASYVAAPRRPLLSLSYLGRLKPPPEPEPRLPAFFRNLLPDPDGPLHRLVVAAAGAPEDQELHLLAYLGEDLPGAVRIRATGALPDELDEPDEPGKPPTPTAPTTRPRGLDGPRLRFSLAGVQLKFSMVRHGKGLTVPARGRGGDWIVKLPDQEFAGLPEVEFMTMEWARDSGIEVPELEIVRLSQLSGIPRGRGGLEESALCLALRRFDRAPGDRRIHIEDFAQVFDRHPEGKYNDRLPSGLRPIGLEDLARAVATYTPEDRREFVRRLVFVILSGNGDAHLKNWSLIYHDGRRPRLSPAYDLVPTVVFLGLEDPLALPLFETTAFSALTLDHFARLGPDLEIPADEVIAWVHEDIARIMDTWATLRGLDGEVRMTLDRHHKRLRSGLLAPGGSR